MERTIVSAATGVMGTVLGKLADLLHEEYKLATGVRKDIEFLRSELSAMNDLLNVLADAEELDALNKGWRDRVRELAYDVEDCMDLSMARLGCAAGDARAACRLGSKLARKLKKIRVSLQVAHQIKELKARAIEESKRHKRYKLDGLVGSSGGAPPNNKVDLRMCALWVETEKLVGLDQPMDKIMRWLMPAEGEKELSQQVRTLSIVGCAGLGKTTLANQVYQKIKGDFQCNAFISVSQNPQMKDALMKISSQVGATTSMADDELILVGKLRDRLKDKRYIVVVDDIWHSDPWKIIGQALVKTSPGSIIIITTRLKDVAQFCCSHDGWVYDMKPLDDDNSKRLFFKRIFDSEEKCPNELESASKDILKKCNGIPLAIISIASFLAVDVPKSPDHWNKVKESISSPLRGNKSVETMKSVLSLSYFNLPHHLRTCLLYLSAFPEDCEIERDRLVCRWIAEGFVNPEPGDSLYEAGLRYFNILINRSLIQPWKEENGVVLSCRVHDVILNFLASKSFEENFLTFLDPSGVHLFLCIARELHPLTEFEVIRVLDLGNCGSLRNIHLENIEMLVQLRYLSIRRTCVSVLPAGIGHVQHLETLDIRETEVEQLPSTIVLLEKLAHLFVSSKVKFPEEGISKMKGLEQLTCLSICGQPISFLKELGQLTNLRILQALCDAMWEPKYYESSEWGNFASSLRALGSHNKLHSLDFEMRMYETEIPIPLDSLLPGLPSLRTFSISPITSLPIWMGSLVNLEVLYLRTLQFTPEYLQVLGNMPALETLVLYIGRYAGPFTIVSGAFQRLRSFSVGQLYQLQFMPGSMPNLKHLHTILVYTSYSDVGIQHLTSLTKVNIFVYAWRNNRGGVEGLESKIRSFLDAHPNRPTLDFHTLFTKHDRYSHKRWEQ
ncbi:unnamed protein product [Urochloa decumbens]|uniref:AAA+ ATPase domain-containing protein n=1 Tax=Urochloa decumbens TaxID=240449 RepID=A0ABC9CMB3_9POAL